MRYIKYKVKLLEPIIVTDTSSDKFFTSSLSYIKGNMILGLLAGNYKKNKKLKDAHTDKSFYDFFLSGELIFSDAVISSVDNKNNTIENHIIPFFIQEDKKNSSEAINIFEERRDKTKNIEFGRFLYVGHSSDDKSNDVIYKQSVVKQLNYHHERNYEKGTAEPSNFFNYESINQGQVFIGKIIGSNELLNNFLASFKNPITGQLGRSKTAQYGKVQLEFEEANIDVDSKKGINENLVITLTSDAIIYNVFGYPTLELSYLVKEIQNSADCDEIKIVNIEDADITNNEKAFVRKGLIENYVSILKSKKQMEICFKAGSTIEISGKNINVEKLVTEGIGERKNEGYGQVQTFEDLKKVYTCKEFIDKPIQYSISENISEFTQNLISNIITTKFREYVINSAIQNVNSIDEDVFNIGKDDAAKITNSIVGRLEIMIKAKKDYSEFIDNLNNLKQQAKDKITSIYLSNLKINLLEHLKKLEIDSSDINLTSTVSELGKHGVTNLPDLIPDKNQYKKLYVLSFLRTLRKKIKIHQYNSKN